MSKKFDESNEIGKIKQKRLKKTEHEEEKVQSRY